MEELGGFAVTGTSGPAWWTRSSGMRPLFSTVEMRLTVSEDKARKTR